MVRGLVGNLNNRRLLMKKKPEPEKIQEWVKDSKPKTIFESIRSIMKKTLDKR
tara:strand:+ start:172 stop:330 length:159 start_codon:yes stop_codon:yes gene_type:complete